MSVPTIGVKLLSEKATMPSGAYSNAAGLDLSIISKEKDFDNNTALYNTGIALDIPEHMYVLLYPRSSISQMGYIIPNSVGVIDADYRGEIKVALRKVGDQHLELPCRIAQLVPCIRPAFEFRQIEELSETERGTRGFGSTGKN